MKNNKLQINKQKIALIVILIAVAVGGYMFFQNSPETEATAPVAEAPAVPQPEVQAQQPVQEQPAAPVEAETPPAQTLGASSSGLGR